MKKQTGEAYSQCKLEICCTLKKREQCVLLMCREDNKDSTFRACGQQHRESAHAHTIPDPFSSVSLLPDEFTGAQKLENGSHIFLQDICKLWKTVASIFTSSFALFLEAATEAPAAAPTGKAQSIILPCCLIVCVSVSSYHIFCLRNEWKLVSLKIETYFPTLMLGTMTELNQMNNRETKLPYQQQKFVCLPSRNESCEKR